MSEAYIQILSTLKDSIEQLKKRIERELDTLRDFSPEISAHLKKMQGKYFRAVLLLLVADMTQQSKEDSLKLAKAVELLHLATLIHDDVLDDADLRRSQKTLHLLWGNRAAILTGDFLYSKTTQLLLEFKDSEVLDDIADITVGFTRGELTQLLGQKTFSVELEPYLRVIELKTARFMGVCARFGGILKLTDSKALFEFGKALGMAFQISDDLLDWMGSPDEAKPFQQDLKRGVVSLPLVLALQAATSNEKKDLELLWQHSDDRLLPEAQALIQRYQGFLKAHQMMLQYLNQAREILKVFERTNLLVSLLDFIENRIPVPK